MAPRAVLLQIRGSPRYARRVSRLVATSLVLFLAWSMLPGGAELVENASHLIMHGDLAHDQTNTGHGPFNLEHACSGGFHLCSCCHSQLSESTFRAPFSAPQDGSGILTAGRLASPGLGFPQAHKEPPRA